MVRPGFAPDRTVGRASFLSETKIGQFHHETGVSEFQCTGPRGCILMDRSVARHPRPWHAIIDGEAADTADSSGDELMLGYQTMWRAACDAQPMIPTPSPRPLDIISQLIKERAVHGLRRGHDAYSTTSH